MLTVQLTCLVALSMVSLSKKRYSCLQGQKIGVIFRSVFSRVAGEEVEDGHDARDPADHDHHNPHACVAVIISVEIVDDEEDTLG